MRDIENLDDIKLLVNTFYDNVRRDDLLKDIFENVINDRWDEHLEKMYRFWQTVLLEEHTYHGSPFMPHAGLPVDQQHFEQWVFLFSQTVNGLFSGEKAERCKWQGQRMAEMFLSKIQYYRKNNAMPLA